jgi:short-subunit dehydrogenase
MLSQTKPHQTIIITGGNSRLGYQCAKAIAQSDSPLEQLSRHKCRLRDERNCSRTVTSDYAREVP